MNIEHGATSRFPAALERPRKLSSRDLLLFVARCASVDHSASATESLRRHIRRSPAYWSQVVDFANSELLAPLLWVVLSEKGVAGDLPPEAADRLRRAHLLNRVRHERIRGELLAILRALNAAGIVPVLLKGAVDLFVNRYSDPAARILRDLDLLVLKPGHDRAVVTLRQMGYRLKEREAAWVTYSSDLVRAGAMAPVDLQWFISGQRGVLSPEDAWRDSLVHHECGVEFRTLSIEHQLVHNLLHSELQDRGSDVGFVWLRQLLDFVALCRLHEGAIEWSRVIDSFARHGLRRVPVKRLYMAQRLLGLPMPQGLRPTLAARFHYARCLTQLRWRWSMGLAGMAAAGLSSLDGRLLDLIYETGEGRRALAGVRVRHGLRLLGHYGTNLPDIVRKRRKKFS